MPPVPFGHSTNADKGEQKIIFICPADNGAANILSPDGHKILQNNGYKRDYIYNQRGNL